MRQQVPWLPTPETPTHEREPAAERGLAAPQSLLRPHYRAALQGWNTQNLRGCTLGRRIPVLFDVRVGVSRALLRVRLAPRTLCN